MKRLPWVLAASALCVGTLNAGPPPPPASGGPVLQITFSGLVVFRQNGKGYRVVLPERQDHGHRAYVLFPKANSVTDAQQKTDFECGGANYEWIPLEGDRLTVDSKPLVAPLFTEPPDLSGWLVHLSSLVPPGSQFNDLDYNQITPKKGNVAAQVDVTRGTLEPATDASNQPVEWEFKTDASSEGEAPPKPVRICGVSGTNWLLALKPGTKQISLNSSLKRTPIVTFTNLSDGETRMAIVGNSRTEDIKWCEVRKPMAKSDPDFKIHYLVVKGEVSKQFIPVKVDPPKPCNPKSGPGEPKRSLRGSDCMGGQWP